MKKIAFLVLLIVSFNAWSQVEDSETQSFDFSLEGDTLSVDSETDGDESGTPEEAAKPYERIVLAIDSNTNLIEYTGIVEQEESSSDSLYIRTKNFAAKYLSDPNSKGKANFELDKKSQKLVINAVMPAYAYTNKYTKRSLGTYQFKMTVWFKEGRYKYTITNLVHEANKPSNGVAKRNYFEYYYTTTTNIKGVDGILRFADKDINEMLEKYKKAMKEPVYVDEDEW